MQSVIWLWCRGFSAALWWKALAQFGLIEGAIIFGVATLAALTTNFRRFLLAAIVAVALYLLWMGLLLTLERFGCLPTIHLTNVVVENNRTALTWLLLAVGMLVAWVLQSFAARRRYCVAAMALVLLASIPLCTYWRGAEILIRSEPVKKIPVSLTVLGEDDSLDDSPGSQILWSHFLVNGLGPRQLAGVYQAQGTFLGENKTRVNINASAKEWGGRLLDHYEADVFQLVRGCFPTNTLWYGWVQTRRASGLPVTNKGQLPKGQHGKLSGNLGVSIYDVRQLADLPLKVKAAATVLPGCQVRIESVSLNMESISVKLSKSAPDLLFSPETDRYLDLSDGECVYVLYHPSYGEAYPYTTSNDQSNTGTEFGTQNGSVNLDFKFPALRARLTGITVQEWLKHARLLVFQPMKQGQGVDGARPPHIASFPFDQEDYIFKRDRTAGAIQGSRAAALAVIRAATLPPQPDAAQMERYIKTIADNAFMNFDPAMRKVIEKKLAVLGKEAVPVITRLLPFEDKFESTFIIPFLVKNVGRLDVPDLLKALPQDFNLARLFQEKKWDADARPAILSQLPDHRIPLSGFALMIVASAHDPQTYPELSWHFIHARTQSLELIQALQQCPGFDLEAAVRAAWKLARLSLGSDDPLCVEAAAEGLPEALNISIRKLQEDNKYDFYRKRLVLLTDYHGTDKDFEPWLVTHLGHFRYDMGLRRYAAVE